jgi:hypothetical protein
LEKSVANLFEFNIKLWFLLTFLCVGSFTLAQTDTSPASSLPLLAAGLHMGTTFYSSGRVPENQETLNALEEAVTAGMNAFHFNQDWPALEPASGIYNLTELKATLTWLKSQGLTPYLNINLVDIDHLNLPADYLDEAGNLAAGVRFNDPVFIERFNQLLAEVAPLLVEHGGFYLGVGNEVDERFSEYPEELSPYLEFVAAVREHVHELEPRLAMGVTVTSNSILENSAIVSQLQRVSDVVPFNYYPTDDTLRVKDFSLIPDDFKTLIAAYGDNPIIIQELGCPSAEVMNSSLEKQQRCFETMFATLAAYPQVRFVSVFAFQDLDEATCDVLASYINLEQLAAEGLPAQFLERFRAFLCTLGLRQANGSAKPAWQSFLNELQRIAQTAPHE